MALVLTIQHWRHYLLGRKFEVFSNQKSLRNLSQQRITTSNQQEWMAKLLGLGLRIKWQMLCLANIEDVKVSALISYPIWQQVKEL